MLQKCRKMLRNEKGLTLIELLAVVVILGIIAAIAIPSIGNIIEKSREDAHKATALQIMSGARMAIASEEVSVASDTTDTIIVVTSTEGETTELDEFVEKIDDQYTRIVVNTLNGKVDTVELTNSDKTIKFDEDGEIVTP